MASTIAELKAVISADTAALDARLSKVEVQMKQTQAMMEKSAEAMNGAFTRAASASNRTIEESSARAQRAAMNRTQYEYQMGQKSADDFKKFLQQRMQSFEAYTSEWKAAATQMVSLERELTSQRLRSDQQANREMAEAKRQADAERIASERKFQEEYTALLAEEEAAARSVEKARADDAKATDLANKQKQESLANLAKFEYENGNLSAEAYQVFLQRRMSAFAIYTNEWKVSSRELVNLEKGMLAEREAANAEYEASINAQVKEALAERAAIEREMTAILAEEDAKRLAANRASVEEYVAEQQAAAEATTARWQAVGSALSNTAALITGIEAVTAGMYAGFEAKTTAVANNTLMTNAQLKEMQQVVLSTGKATGAELDDISDGYMRIANHAYKGAEAQNILMVASKEAISTQSKVDSTANALAGTMHVFHIKGGEAANTMNLIAIAAARGNSTIQEWTDNTGKATGMAANYGVQLADVEAALSALTQQKFSTSEANTQVTNLLNHIANPTAEARKNIELLQARANSMGIDLVKDFSSSGLAGRGLYGVLSDIKQVTGGNAEAVNSLIGAMRGGIGAMALMKSGAKDYHDALVLTTKAQKGLADTTVDQRFDRAMQAGQNQWKQFIRTIQVEFMPVGERAMKLFITWMPTIKRIADAVLTAMEAFQKLPQPVQSAVTAFGALSIVAKLGIDFLRFFGATVKVTDGARFLIKALGPGEGLLWAFRGAAGAGTGFGASLAELSLAGTGPIAILVLAVAGLAFELYKLKGAYDDMRSAQDQAAKSAQNFANAEAQAAASSASGAAVVAKLKVSTEIADLQGALQDAWGHWNPGIGGKARQANRDIFASDALKSQGYDTSNPNYSTESGMRARLAALEASLPVLTNYLHDQAKLTAEQRRAAVGSGHYDPKVVPTYVQSMMQDLGKYIGRDCAGELTKVLGASVSSFDTRANRVGPDASGNYPEGTLMHAAPGDRYGRGHFWAVHYENGAAHRLESNIENPQHRNTRNPDYVSDDRVLSKADIAAATWGGYTHAFMPGGGGGSNDGIPYMPPTATNGGITHADMQTMADRAKAAKEAAKQEEAERKAAQKRYKEEIDSLHMIISLKAKKEDLDTNNEVEKARQLLAEPTKLGLIKDTKQREALLKLAAQADVAEHAAYVKALVDKMNDQVAVASKSYLEQRAIQNVGGLDKWNALGTVPGAQKSYMGAIQAQEDTAARFKAVKDLQDLAFAQKIAGDEVKKAAVEAEGGAEKWGLLDDATKRTVLDTERQVLAMGQLDSMVSSFQRKADESTQPKSNTASAIAQINELVRKGIIKDPATLRNQMGPLSRNDQADLDKTNQAMKAAGQADQGDADTFLKAQGRSLDDKWEQYQQKISEKYFPSFANARQAALDKWKKDNFDAIDNILQHGTDAEKEKLNVFEDRIKKEAQDEENAESAQFLVDQRRQLQAKSLESQNAIADMYNAPMKAVHDWEAANAEALARIRADWGDVGQAAIKAYEDELKAQTVQQQAQATRQKQIEDYANTAKQLMDASDKPNSLQAYIDSFKQLQQIGVDEQGRPVFDFVLPPGFDTDLAKANFQLQKQLDLRKKISDMMSQGTQALAQGFMNGLNSAFNPDPQQRGSLQQQKLEQQNEYMQYQVAEQQFKNQYPNDPNDPYIQRLQQIQQQIDQTNKKISGMGNNLSNVFTRLFKSIYDSFTQTLTKMAEEYLQSQILKYLSRQIGTGSGFTSGGSNWASTLTGIISTGLGFLSLGKGGGGGGGGSAPTQSPVATPAPSAPVVYYAAEGGRAIPGVPTYVNDNEVLIPDGPGMIVPLGKLKNKNGGGAWTGESGGSQTVINQNFHITTPDVRGFRQSKASMMQDARRAMKTIR
jgi:colicin import membrane protein